ncbi:MAG: HdeD family acid-resistance protein [Acetobacteraceae bacterium]
MSDLTASDRRRPRTAWGWFVALGVAQLVLGIVAWFDVIAFTIAGVIFIGALLLIAGAFQIIHAFMDREWGAFALHVLMGVLYVIGGALLMAEPLEGSVVITILVAAALIIGGVLRVIMAVRHRGMTGWGLLLAGGLISLGVGVLLYVTLPWSGLWVVGTLIAVELIVQGVGWLQFGLALRRSV